MPEIAVTEKLRRGKNARAAAAKKKAFNSFQIAQTQFDKVAEYSGSGSGNPRTAALPIARVPLRIPGAHG